MRKDTSVQPVKKAHEPFVHITKRGELVWWRAWLIRAGALILAMLLCGLVTVMITDLRPMDVYVALFNGNFGPEVDTWVVFRDMAILLCISLAVTPAFKMRFWNIGAEGQVLMGGLASAACMIYIKDAVPNWLLLLIMLAASLAVGALWAAIPAICKAKWETNETLFTLMMNYIATQLIAFLTIFWERPKGSGTIGVINQMSEAGWMPSLFGNRYVLCIIIVAALTVAMFIYLRYSKQGYEISVVGESENTARYIGINVGRVIVRTMILSGAICGLAGFLLVGGIDHTITTTTAGGQGFTAIMVSWLAKFNPIFMSLTAFLITFLQKGAQQIATGFRLDPSFSDILTGIILFFIIGCEFFIHYKLNFRTAQKEEK
ncbi:MAG: ABC transporter permease [Clostridia bacterium]|nr:ABC transporter permease [Clostridia bacterium]